jgi:hypothetical protein
MKKSQLWMMHVPLVFMSQKMDGLYFDDHEYDMDNFSGEILK